MMKNKDKREEEKKRKTIMTGEIHFDLLFNTVINNKNYNRPLINPARNRVRQMG